MRTYLRGLLMVFTWIAVAGGVVWVAVKWSSAIGGVLCVAAMLIPFAYILVCTLYPSWGDTKCPRCGKPALRRPDSANPVGVVCDACGYEDPELYRAYLNEMR
ncbi:MAG: hypothetical protein K8T20_17035 [Planctomycetes bacterium]|nr:hypothetical protein [Planctomycetota bacterium]